MPRLNARWPKCILVLFPDEVVALGDVPTPRVTLTIEAAGYWTRPRRYRGEVTT